MLLPCIFNNQLHDKFTNNCLSAGKGFAIKKFEDLPDAWRSYFFDAEDCRKANEIVTDIFNNQNISWTHTENKFKMFISAFQQLQVMINKE